MKIYEALYCCCVHESSYATLSIHKTKEGAEKAIQEHKDQMKKECEDMNKDDDWAKAHYIWNQDKDWDIHETELLD